MQSVVHFPLLFKGNIAQSNKLYFFQMQGCKEKKKSPVSLFVHVLATLGKQKLQDKSNGDQLQLILHIQTTQPWETRHTFLTKFTTKA